METLPTEAALFAALEATWPPSDITDLNGWRARFAPGAGSRVNSARRLAPEAPLDDAVIDAIVAAYAGRGQPALLQLGSGDADPRAAALLAARGFHEFDPCALGVADIEFVAGAEAADLKVLTVGAPLAALEELWSEGDGGPSRRAVMARARGPSRVIAARIGDRIAGAVFAAVADGLCFEHALHVSAQARRHGVGRALMRAAARFGRGAGATRMAVSVRRGNAPARALFEGLGFRMIGGYGYWRRD